MSSMDQYIRERDAFPYQDMYQMKGGYKCIWVVSDQNALRIYNIINSIIGTNKKSARVNSIY